jgi:hypothetical protein
MATILNTIWGLIVSLFGHLGLFSLWMAGGGGAVLSLYALSRLLLGRMKDAGKALLAAATIMTLPGLIGWGLCRLYANVHGREIDSWFWAGAGVLFGLLAGFGAANDFSRDSRKDRE